MRVLAVGNLYPPHDQGGGYELVWHRAVQALRARGHDVRVLTTTHREPTERPDDPDVHRELGWYWQDHGFPRRPLWRDVAMERRNAAILRRHLADHRPDFVAWWSMGGMSLSLLETCRRAGVPAVAFVHDDWLDYGPRADGWQRRFRQWPELAPLAERMTGVPTRIPYADVAHYAFVSRATRDHAWSRGVPTPDRSVVHSGIDAALIDPAPPKDWSWSLLSVGRIDARKGIDTAVAALAHLPPEATLTVAGQGDPAETRRLAALAEAHDLGDRVRFLGGVPRAALPSLYAEADVVVFPVRWREPWGLVPLEAMARGRPVVATGRGGSAEYLEDGGNALLFPAGDSAALAERVRRLARDESLRAALRERGLDAARAHTEDRFNAAVEATLLACRRASRPVPAQEQPDVAVVLPEHGPVPLAERVAAVRAGGAAVEVITGDFDAWRRARAPVVLFLDSRVLAGPGLVAAHAEAHRLSPAPDHAAQGRLQVPMRGFARWVQRRGHPPLEPPVPGEVGTVRLDLQNVSFKRNTLDRLGALPAGGLADFEVGYRLAELGVRLRYVPTATARVAHPATIAQTRACLTQIARDDARWRHLNAPVEPWLEQRAQAATNQAPTPGRLGRLLVPFLSPRVPWIGGLVWLSASAHYEPQLGAAYLDGLESAPREAVDAD